jgi:hypothetical protein
MKNAHKVILKFHKDYYGYVPGKVAPKNALLSGP